ncbi:MAG: carbohydrate ABC transporter permease [Phycisphaerales bacterium]
MSEGQTTREIARGLLWTSPWLAGFALFTAIPAAMSVWLSLTDYSLLERPVYVGLANYRELAADPVVRAAARNTMVYAAMAVIGGTVLSLVLAGLLERGLRGSGLVRAIVFAPTLAPPASAAMVWLWMYNPGDGPLARGLGAVGVSSPNFLGDARWALPSMAVMGLWSVGSAVVVYSAAMRGVPRALYEAAEVDGARAGRRWWHVTLPGIAPAVVFNVVMAVIWSLQLFAWPLIMTRGGPERSTQTLSMSVYFNAFVYGRMGYACALAWLQLVVTLGLTAVVLGVARRAVYYRAG